VIYLFISESESKFQENRFQSIGAKALHQLLNGRAFSIAEFASWLKEMSSTYREACGRGKCSTWCRDTESIYLFFSIKINISIVHRCIKKT